VQFWSETGPAFAQTQIIIPLPTTVFLQLDGQNLGENLTVYPFTAAGTYVGYTKKTNADSTAYFNLPAGDYKFRYTYEGVQFWSNIIGAENNALINIPAPTAVTVKLGTQPLGENLTIYPFTAAGAYVGYTKTTDANSIAWFNLPAGDYKFRYTYEGVQFWSNIISAGTAGQINLPSPVTAVTVKLGTQPLGENLTVYPFTADGTYIGYTKSTDTSSTAYFDLPAGEYKFRYTYEGVQFWSDITPASTQTDIYIPLPTPVILQLDGQNLGENLTVYPFTADGSYIGYTQKTDAESIAYFNLPAGEYKFRYTHEGVQFWSDIISAENNALLNIPAPTPVTVKLGTQPLGENLTVYPFTAAGAYLGYTQKTDADSTAWFNLPAGEYKFRYTYDGVQFWSEEVTVPAFQTTNINIPLPTTVTVLRLGELFSENLTLYPFTATGAYLGYTKKTNTDSTASFNLPAGTYNFRTTIEGVVHWLYGISAEENAILHTNHTRITLQNQGAPAGSGVACALLNANGNETGTTFVTDENSALAVLSLASGFRMKCNREDELKITTKIITAGENTTLDFMAQITWRLHYGINKPSDYTEKICFTDTFIEKEKCFTAQDEYTTTINAGTYNLTHKLEHRTYGLGEIDFVLSDSVQEFDFNMPEIRQLLFTIAENPQANVELRLLRGETRLFGHTNDNGFFYFTESGEWQVYRQHEFVGTILAGQNSVHLNPDIPPLPANTRHGPGPELINPYDYDLVTEGRAEIFMPERSGSFINPTARVYGKNLNTALNQTELSIPFYSTCTTELKFLLFKTPDDYMTETEPEPILEIPFPVQPGENEFVWQGVNDRGRLFTPGYYYFLIKPENTTEAVIITVYDENLELTGKDTVDFALTY
jgi:hypothetical protein